MTVRIALKIRMVRNNVFHIASSIFFTVLFIFLSVFFSRFFNIWTFAFLASMFDFFLCRTFFSSGIQRNFSLVFDHRQMCTISSIFVRSSSLNVYKMRSIHFVQSEIRCKLSTTRLFGKGAKDPEFKEKSKEETEEKKKSKQKCRAHELSS